MRIQWTLFALERVEVLADFIAHDSPAAAAKMVDELFRGVGRLAVFPEMGHVAPQLKEPSIRQVHISRYRLIYLLDRTEEVLVVLTVQHTREAPYSPDALSDLVEGAEEE